MPWRVGESWIFDDDEGMDELVVLEVKEGKIILTKGEISKKL